MSDLPACPECQSPYAYEQGVFLVCPECGHEWSAALAGTRVKSIRLVAGDHDIDCKIEGIGAMKLKSEFVKKA
ncbi:MAG: alkylphosphonate utilization protein [Haliea sp.]|nr:alkylphosphonate utilization protein [Haliea sp.]